MRWDNIEGNGRKKTLRCQLTVPFNQGSVNVLTHPLPDWCQCGELFYPYRYKRLRCYLRGMSSSHRRYMV